MLKIFEMIKKYTKMEEIIAATSSSSSWGLGVKEVFVFDREAFLFCLFFSSVFFVYLRSQRILKVTLLVRGENPQEQAC